MTDLLDGDEFYELMKAFGDSQLVKPHETILAFEDVKNYIRIHCVVPQTNPVQEEQDESVPWD